MDRALQREADAQGLCYNSMVSHYWQQLLLFNLQSSPKTGIDFLVTPLLCRILKRESRLYRRSEVQSSTVFFRKNCVLRQGGQSRGKYLAVIIRVN